MLEYRQIYTFLKREFLQDTNWGGGEGRLEQKIYKNVKNQIENLGHFMPVEKVTEVSLTQCKQTY